MSSSATAGSPRSTSAPPPPPHLLVFPFPAQGHIIPLLDFLHHLSLRSRSLTITIILTPQNAHLLSPYSSSSIQTLILPLPSHPSIPYGAENVKDLPNASYGIALAHALLPLHVPVVNWARSQSTTPPTALLSDFFLGWTQSLIASELNIPYLVFYSSGALLASVLHYLWNSDNDSRRDGLIVPDFLLFPEPHYPSVYRRYRKGVPEWECMRDGMLSNSAFNWGLVLNTFEDIESVYLEHLKKEFGHRRVWAVGPILPFGPIEKRGGSSESEEVLQSWLDSCPEENSVVYISFGSQYRIPMAMAAAIAMGIEKSGVKFIWCVKEVGGKGSSVVPEGFEERMKGRGVVVRGWAPQVVILRHKAVGAFLTHCGWNSVLEGLVAGVTLLTWPMEADQFVNARLLVEEIGVGIKVWEGADTLPDSDEMGRMLAGVVDINGSCKPVREKAAEIARKAKAAVEGGGHSNQGVDELLMQLSAIQSNMDYKNSEIPVHWKAKGEECHLHKSLGYLEAAMQSQTCHDGYCSLMASLISAPLALFFCTLSPNLNFLLLVQLELSVKETSPKSAVPSVNVIHISPVSNGLLPSLSRIKLLLNSLSVQSSCPSPPKSLSRTRMSTLNEDRCSDVTIAFEKLPTSAKRCLDLLHG